MTYDQIAFGSKLSTSWVQKFARGTIREPRLKHYNALKQFFEQRAA